MKQARNTQTIACLKTVKKTKREVEMKLSYCSLPRLYQERTGRKETSGKKEPFRNIAGL